MNGSLPKKPGGSYFLMPALCLLILGGCTVGPKFHRPDAPQVSSYTSPKAVISTENTAPGSRLAFAKDIPAQWWEIFQSEKIDKVIRMALADSPTLVAAEAALREARENYNARSGQENFPSADLGLSADRAKSSNAALGSTDGKGSLFNLFNASVSVSYLLDIFGGGRRELESLRAEIDYQNFKLEAAYLSLTSNIVAAVGKEVALRSRIAITRDILKLEADQLNMLEQQLEFGGTTRAIVLAQQSLIEQTRAELPPLERELALTRHELTALAGKFPHEEKTLPEFDFADLKLPEELPVSLPSELVNQRPDIRASEALLHIASADIGVATANMLPQITLTSGYGSQANAFGKMFSGNTNIWNVGAGLAQPVFNGGELRARKRAAVAAYDQAAAQYRQTVLLSFQDVANVLRALETDTDAIATRRAAEAAALATYELAQAQFKAGAVSYLFMLDSQRQYYQSRIALVQALATQFADTAALFQALGGGWWNRDSKNEVMKK